MADLDDLGFTSISAMQTDEALELLRQIRLSRRTPIKTTKTYSKRQTTKTTTVDADQAAAILAILGGVDDQSGESGDDSL